MAARKCASRVTYMAASARMPPTRDSAACTGWRSVTTPTPAASSSAPRTMKATISVIHAFQLGARRRLDADAHLLALGGRLAALPLAARGAHQHVFLAVDEVLVAEVGELELVAQHDRARGASLLAEAAEDAAQHVDLVDLGVALAGRHRVVGVVLRRLHVDGVGGAGGGAQAAADALLEARVGMPQQVVAPAEARLDVDALLRVGDGVGTLEQVAQRDPHPLGDVEDAHGLPPFVPARERAGVRLDRKST